MTSSIWWKLKRSLFGLLVRTSNAIFGKEIVHRSRFAHFMNEFWLWLVERFSPARRRQARFEKAHPDAPWFVPAAIDAIESYLRPDHIGFEWGCGRSTLWFARRVAHITSVEGRKSWFHEVQQWLARDGLGQKVTLKLAEVTSEHNFLPAEIERYAGVIDEIPDGSLDFVVVDGHFREACLARARSKVRKGGLLIVDNSEVVPPSQLDSIRSTMRRSWNNGIWETTIIDAA